MISYQTLFIFINCLYKVRFLQFMIKKEIYELIDYIYKENEKAKEILLIHSKMVLNKALLIANQKPELNINIDLLIDGVMLHDIGIIKTNSPKINCYGKHPYIMHGVLGKEIIEKTKFKHLALFAERHTGTGLSKEDIINNNLPLPHYDMLPISIEEQLLCFADLFYSKGKGELENEKSISKIRKSFSKFGIHQVEQFDKWCKIFL